MLIHKHIALVDAPGGVVARLTPELENLGVRVLLVSEPHLVLEAIADLRKLAS
jgi:hypothetical protein